MILKDLELRNYRQLPDGTYSFEGNLIGIVGRNGSGKSHLIEALPFLLTGDGQRSKMLKWGALSGHATLRFSHNQRDYTVKRSLEDAGAALVVSGEGLDKPLKVTGATAVTDYLGKALGIDKDIARQSMFAKQAEIDAVLFTDPKIREIAMQKLCGVGDAQKTHKTLGDILAKMPVQYDLDDEIAKAEAQVKFDDDLLSGEQAKLVALVDEMSFFPVGASAQRDAVFERKKQAENYLTRKASLATIEGDIARAQEKLKQLVCSTPEEQQALEGNISAYSAAVVDLKHEQEWKQKMADVEKALQSLQTPPSENELSVLQSTINEAVTQMSRASMSKEMYSNLMAAVSSLQGTQVCPLCGSYITDVDRIKREVVAKLEAVNEAYMAGKQVREAAEGELRSKSASRTATELAKTRLETSRERLGQDLASLTYTEAKCEGSVQEAELALAEAKANLAAMTAAKEESSRLKGALDGLVASKKSLEDTIASSTAYDALEVQRCIAEIAEFDRVIEQVRRVELAVAVSNGRISEIGKRLEASKASLESLKVKRESVGTLKEVIQVLGNVRDWFHYTMGPHTIAVTFLRRLTVGVNEFLGYFSAPFVVAPEESTLGFRVSFTDGRQMPSGGYADASELSGGEKIMLAVSFRLANYRIFASKLGLLSLDEPTVYLDDENVGNFCKVVEALKMVVQAMNLQVLIATHERAVMPYFSSTINLNKEE